MAQFTVGTRVAFSRAFLISTGQYTGWAPFARGKIITLDTLSPGCVLAAMLWDDGSKSPRFVNVSNLVAEDRINLEPQ